MSVMNGTNPIGVTTPDMSFVLILVCSSDSCVFPIGTLRRECLAHTHLLQLWLQILPL